MLRFTELCRHFAIWFPIVFIGSIKLNLHNIILFLCSYYHNNNIRNLFFCNYLSSSLPVVIFFSQQQQQDIFNFVPLLVLCVSSTEMRQYIMRMPLYLVELSNWNKWATTKLIFNRLGFRNLFIKYFPIFFSSPFTYFHDLIYLLKLKNSVVTPCNDYIDKLCKSRGD